MIINIDVSKLNIIVDRGYGEEGIIECIAIELNKEGEIVGHTVYYMHYITEKEKEIDDYLDYDLVLEILNEYKKEKIYGSLLSNY